METWKQTGTAGNVLSLKEDCFVISSWEVTFTPTPTVQCCEGYKCTIHSYINPELHSRSQFSSLESFLVPSTSLRLSVFINSKSSQLVLIYRWPRFSQRLDRSGCRFNLSLVRFYFCRLCDCVSASGINIEVGDRRTDRCAAAETLPAVKAFDYGLTPEPASRRTLRLQHQKLQKKVGTNPKRVRQANTSGFDISKRIV